MICNKFYVDEANNYVIAKPAVHHPDHLYCHQCKTRLSLPEDEAMRLVGAPMLPGMEE